MATTEVNSRITTKDAQGNTQIHYPVTKTECLIGDPVPINMGGTGAANAASALSNLGGVPALHNHDASAITGGTLPIARGGTGGSTASAARSALGITPANIGAATQAAAAAAQSAADTAVADAAAAQAAADDAAAAAAAAQTTADSKSPALHTHAVSQLTAGTFAGRVLANQTAQAVLTDAQLRSIYVGTGAMTAGSTSLVTGMIYLQYE